MQIAPLLGLRGRPCRAAGLLLNNVAFSSPLPAILQRRGEENASYFVLPQDML